MLCHSPLLITTTCQLQICFNPTSFAMDTCPFPALLQVCIANSSSDGYNRGGGSGPLPPLFRLTKMSRKMVTQTVSKSQQFRAASSPYVYTGGGSDTRQEHLAGTGRVDASEPAATKLFTVVAHMDGVVLLTVAGTTGTTGMRHHSCNVDCNGKESFFGPIVTNQEQQRLQQHIIQTVQQYQQSQ